MSTNTVDIKSPDHSNDPAFAMSVWVTGAPVVADATPPTNLASVPANRIVRCAGKRGSITLAGMGQLRAAVIGGTSVALQAWFYDDTMAVWVSIVPTLTVNASTCVQLATVLPMYGAKLYASINTVTGGVTAVGYDYY